jgi:hypothetical protein
MTKMMSNNTVMSGLEAESLLKDSILLTRIEHIHGLLQAKSDGTNISLDDRYREIRAAISRIPGISLQASVPTKQGGRYQNELLLALEAIQDQVETLNHEAIHFQGQLLRIKADIEEISGSFKSWYFVAALEFLKQAGIKLPAQTVKDLALSEFNRLMNQSNLTVTNLIEALKVEMKRLDSKHKTAKLKFEMGREQANISYMPLPESQGTGMQPRFGLLQEVEEEETGETNEGAAFAPEYDEDGEPELGQEYEDEYSDETYLFGADPVTTLLDGMSELDELALATDLIIPQTHQQFKTGDAVLITEDFTLTSGVTDIGQFKADVRLHMDVLVTPEVATSANDWAGRFERDADKLAVEGPAPGTHPALHQALIDASRSQAESLRQDSTDDLNSDAL